MDSAVSYKCPCCGGTLVWNSKKQQMACEYCDNTFTEEQLKEILDLESSEASESEMNWNVTDETAVENQMEHMKVHISPPHD